MIFSNEKKDNKMNKEELLKRVKKNHPNLVFKNKNTNWLWKVVGFFSPSLLKNFTTIESTIWCPEEMNGINIDAATLSHEECHLNQIWYSKLFNVNPETDSKNNLFFRLAFYFKYLFWPLPFKFAFFRAEKEIEAFLYQFLDEENPEGKATQQKKDRAKYFITSSYYGYAVSETKADELIDMVSKRLER